MDSLRAFCEPAVLFGIHIQREGKEACVQLNFALPRNVFLVICFDMDHMKTVA